MATRPQALIVGAGIAGLSAAWWLDKAGWSCIVVEKASAIREGGYIVSLSGLCLDTIKHMGLQEKLDSISYKFKENVVRDNRGYELLRLQYKDVHGGLDSLAICRGDLAKVLAEALPETASIRYGETLKSADDLGEKVRVTMEGGDNFEVDLVIGADGLRSSVRDKFWKGVDCLENLGYSYAVYDVEETKELDSDCISFNSPGHLDVLYGLRGNRLAALHIWRSDRTELQNRVSRFGTLRNATTGRTQVVSEVLDSAEQAGSTPLIDSLTMVALPQWSKGRILLFGDAAHCLTLMSGQGAGMALASAEMLGKALKETQDVPQALASHEKQLRPIIERLQRRSHDMAAMYIPKSTFMYYLRNLILKFMPYSWVVSWHVSSAKAEIDLMNKIDL